MGKAAGISYKSAWRMWKRGQLPLPVEQLPTGTVIVPPSSSVTEGGAVLYARVSSAEHKADLDRQIARLSEVAASRHLIVTDGVKEIGSGLNGHRRAILKLLRKPASRTVVVGHRDRLMRFGFEYVEAALAAQGRTLTVIEPEERKDAVEPTHKLRESAFIKAMLTVSPVVICKTVRSRVSQDNVICDIFKKNWKKHSLSSDDFTKLSTFLSCT
jgi:predicted site-specific integrase-resolvase